MTHSNIYRNLGPPHQLKIQKTKKKKKIRDFGKLYMNE